MEKESVNTKLTEDLAGASLEERYDAQCKLLLSEKPILARIMKGCMEEYKDCTVDEIEKYIEGKPAISNFSLNESGKTIRGQNTEDKSLSEGTIYYDIRFTALAPSTNEPIELIINIEAQNKYNPGYPLVKRGLYYASRLISAQNGVEFTKEDYGKIKKVYSVWICMNPPVKQRNTIVGFNLAMNKIAGKVSESAFKKQDYDLLSVIFVNLDINGGGENNLLELLNLIFHNDMQAFDKCKALEDNFGIAMREEISKEVVDMCNLSSGVLEKGYNAGVNCGLSQGLYNARYANAKNMLSDGVPIANVAKWSGLDIADIEKILTENK